MQEIVKFQTNIPQIIALAFDTGVPVESKLGYGDQILYTLEDGRKWYAPPIMAKKFEDLGVGKGERVVVTKTEKVVNRRKLTEWIVDWPKEEEPVGKQQQASPVKVMPAATLETDSKTAPLNGNNNRAYSENGLAAAVNGHAITKSNGAVPYMVGHGPQLLDQSLCAAVDGAAKAETYAKERNYSLRFTSEDIRAIALTLYIQGAREAGTSRWQ